MSIQQRLAALGIELPAPPKPVAAYVPAVTAGGMVYVSGQLPSAAGQVKYAGKVGADVTPEDGYQAARLCAINALSVLQGEVGDLERVARIVRVGGFVNSAPGFTAQPQVINGASELLGEVFGDAGRHARAAVGVSELPLNAAVEVELLVALKP